MSDTCKVKEDMDAIRPVASKTLRCNSDVVMELVYERGEISERLAKLKMAIQRNPEGVSDHHKELWRKQAEAMQAYKEVLGERIKDLIDNE